MKHGSFTTAKKPYLRYRSILEDLVIHRILALVGGGSKDRIVEAALFWKFSPTLLHLELASVVITIKNIFKCKVILGNPKDSFYPVTV